MPLLHYPVQRIVLEADPVRCALREEQGIPPEGIEGAHGEDPAR